MSAPEILVRKLLELAGGTPTSGWTLAVEGPGLESLPERVMTAQGAVAVTRPTTEVELRYQLWRANGAPMLAIVPSDLASRLPPDLVRPARGGRVHALDVSDVLSVVLGSPVTGADDADTRDLALANLEALQQAVGTRTALPSVIDKRTLEELLLDVTVGRRIRTDKPGVLLAEWVRSVPAWSAAVRRLVARCLPSLHATEGAVLAWGLENDRLRAIVVHGVLLAIDGDIADAVWGPLADARNAATLRGLGADVLRRSFAELAEQAIGALSAQDAGPILTDAESAARKFVPPRDQAKSTLLPLGLSVLCDAVAKAAAEGKAVSAADLRRMRTHRAAALHRDDIELLEPMARLSRWCASTEVPVASDVLAHVRGYQTDGAFADLAAAQVRRAMSRASRFQREARALLSRWEDRRNRSNEAFANLLASGYVDALHTRGLVGVHNLWPEHVHAEVQRSKTGVYLVVLDGCSYPVFLELLEELASDPANPIGLRSGDDGARGAAATSILPSITSHARGAIFLGQIPKDPWLSEAVFRDGERTTDPGRFRQNPKLGDWTRKLFLKGDLSSGAMALEDALADSSTRIVSAVFNAIDDQIGSTNTGAMVTIRAGDITGLVPSIRAAFRAQRAVVVVADHGHTPFLGPDHKVGANDTPRFIEVRAGTPPPDGFMTIDVDGLGGATATRAFAWKLGVYLGLPQVGFHGGCGLEEMIIPLATLVENGVPADRPRWWDDAGETAERATAAPAPTPEPRKRTSKTPPESQLPLFSAGESLQLDDTLVAALDDDERRALLVLAQVGSARQQQLAEALRRPAGRIGGFMTILHRKLRNAGIESLRLERLPSGEWNFHWTARRIDR